MGLQIANHPTYFGWLAAALVGALLLSLVVRSVYYAFLHPLAKVPGPKLYAFSSVPYMYHMVRGDWYQRLEELHDEYGPAVRYTATSVSFTTPGAWKHIHGHRAAGQDSFAKDPVFYRQSPNGAPHIINGDDDVHRRQRRLLSHAFSEKALRGQEDVMKRYIDLLIHKLGEQAIKGKSVDMVRWYNYCTFDLIGDLAFGQPFGCLESGGYHPWVAMIFKNIKLGPWAELLKRYPVLVPAAKLVLPAELVRSQKEHWALTEITAKRRLDSGDVAREDFMSYILRHNDEKGMSTDEIVADSNVLIVAGSETTATLLSGTTFYLLTNPDKYAKLVAEIRSTFASEDDITLLRANNLEYMHAVFEESFRMYPPVPIALARKAPRDEYIEGFWIPAGTTVGVPQWASYRSPRNFRNPDQFVPERFLAAAGEEYRHDVRAVLQPFSIGPRNCIGKNLAYAEMRLILARVLYNFDLELLPDSRRWADQKVYTLWEKGALNVRLVPVERG